MAPRQPTFGPIAPDPSDHHRQQQKRTRPCLGCGRPFASAHAGHRVCRRCKGLDAWKSGAGDFAIHAAF